jgi:uncharacterized membrane-anchored protein YjiN (DUF445 family)
VLSICNSLRDFLRRIWRSTNSIVSADIGKFLVEVGAVQADDSRLRPKTDDELGQAAEQSRDDEDSDWD